MSTSPSRAAAAAASALNPDLQAFPYETISGGAGRVGRLMDASSALSQHEPEAAGREGFTLAQARQEGQAEARKSFEAQLARERSSLVTALAQFTRDRATYFQKVELEIVQLSLAIARKILHREAQLDPLLLAGIVHVALEQIDGATGVRLRVHPQNAADWRRYLSLHLDPDDLPEIIEDLGQQPDHCILETSMGTTTIGLEVQLKEIEQGLMDLLTARPGGAP